MSQIQVLYTLSIANFIWINRPCSFSKHPKPSVDRKILTQDPCPLIGPLRPDHFSTALFRLVCPNEPGMKKGQTSRALFTTTFFIHHICDVIIEFFSDAMCSKRALVINSGQLWSTVVCQSTSKVSFKCLPVNLREDNKDLKRAFANQMACSVLSLSVHPSSSIHFLYCLSSASRASWGISQLTLSDRQGTPLMNGELNIGYL